MRVLAAIAGSVFALTPLLPRSSHAQEKTAAAPAATSTDSARKFVPAADLAELERRIRHLLDSTRTPGAGLAIVRSDSVIYAGGIGKARVEPELPATATTLFRIGSTSKAFVALAALQLQREGKLSIDDPVKKYLPDFRYQNAWEATDPIRIVHFLEHTSGFDDNSLRTYASSDPTPLTLEQGLALDTTTYVSRWRPGTRFSYSNPGPAIVARVIETIEGKPFEQVVQARLFDRIGMRTATYLYPDTTRTPMVTLYRGDGKTPFPYWHVFIRPAGSINASAHDMGQYVRFLLGRGTIDGDTILPREDIERMEHPATWIGARAGLPIGYGLHMYSMPDTSGFVWKGHNGGVEGGLSDMSYLPEAGVGYASQINTANAQVLTQMAREVRGFLTRSLPRPAEPPVVAVPSHIAEEFTGWYRAVSPRMQHLYLLERIMRLTRVSFHGDSILVAPALGGATTMLAVDSLRFRRRGESVPTGVFVRDGENGRPQGLEQGMTSWVRVSSGLAVVELALSAAVAAAFLLTLLVALLALVRTIVRALRRRPASPSVARPLWRTAIALAVAVVVPALVLIGAGAGIAEMGNLTMVSGVLYVARIVFAVLALVGMLMAVRPRASTGRWSALSLWTARTVLLLYFVAACYMTYWGFTTWRTWA